MNELAADWRRVPGAKLYEATSDGRIRKGSKTIASTETKRGYRVATLWMDDGTYRQWRVHHLILHAFVGPRPEGMCVRHLDGNSTNNRLENLAYGTYSENNRDTVEHGRHRGAGKTHCAKGHELAGDNVQSISTKPGARRCRECANEAQRAWWSANRAKAPRKKAPGSSECVRGHDLTAPEAIAPSGHCRKCHAENQRKYRAQRRNAA